MRFSIAGMTLNVKGLERLPASWRNYEPFIAWKIHSVLTPCAKRR